MPKTRVPPLPYGRQSIDEDDVAAVESVLRDDWITQGPRIEAFEAAIAEYSGVGHGIAVSSGTAALHSACIAADLGEGDEAIVPTLTFSATAAAVRLTGAEVQLADIDPETLGLSEATAQPHVSSKTKALLAVDFSGQPCDWDGLSQLCLDKEIVSIADAAHALGASYSGRNVGSLADMTCFSFHPVKAITTAEGGMAVTASEQLAHRLRKLRGHGIVRDGAEFLNSDESEVGPWYYEIHDIGLNYRISDVHCALGLSQFQKLDGFISRREELAAHYSEAFLGSDLLKTPVVKADRKSAWHLYTVKLNLDALAWSRGRIFEVLRERGLGVQVHYIPLHLQPYYRDRYGYKRGDFPNAEAYYDSALSIPLFPSMSNEDADDVISIVSDALTLAKR